MTTRKASVNCREVRRRSARGTSIVHVMGHGGGVLGANEIIKQSGRHSFSLGSKMNINNHDRGVCKSRKIQESEALTVISSKKINVI